MVSLQQLVSFINFCVVIYVQSPVAAIVQINDLSFIQQIFAYELCASTVLKALSLNLWYLTGEIAPLCLFSNNLTLTPL